MLATWWFAGTAIRHAAAAILACAGQGLGRMGRNDGRDQGQHDRGGKTELLHLDDELATRIALVVGTAFRQMEISQSGHHQSNELLVRFHIELLLEERGHFGIARFAVTVLPGERGGPVETVGTVALEVVDEHLSRELLDF